MRSMVRLPLLALGLGVIVNAACGPTTVVDRACGPGTVLVNDLCVPDTADEPSCGPLTVRDPATGACIGDVVCGEGTTFDRDLGSCVPSQRCAPGTALNSETGECETIASCAAGTTLVDGRCVNAASCGPGTVLDPLTLGCTAVEPCTPGTSFDAATGTCTNTLACSAGQVEIDGACLDDVAAAAASAAFQEAAIDDNDPARGGTPEAFVLPAAGASTDIAGIVARPVDVDADTVLDQDLDVWSFQGSAGAFITIRAQSNGLPHPAFVIAGPAGYRRESPFAADVEASRTVMLPRTGTYTITVASAQHFLGGEAIGAARAGYYLTVTRLVPPTPTALTLGVAGDPATIGGDLLAVGNLYRVTAGETDLPLVVQVATPATGSFKALAVIALSDDAATLYADDVHAAAAINGFAIGDWSGLRLPAGESALIWIDWVSSRGDEDDYTGLVVSPPEFDFGVVAADTAVLSTDRIIGQGEWLSYRFTSPTRAAVDIGLIAPCSGPLCFASPPEPLLFADLATAGRTALANTVTRPVEATSYTLLLKNVRSDPVAPFFVRVASTSVDAILAVDAVTPVDLAATTVRRLRGLDRIAILLDVQEAGLVALTQDAATGMAGLEVRDALGVIVRQARDVVVGVPVRFLATRPGTYLVRTESALTIEPHVLTDWTFSAVQEPLPSLSEVEPNDTVETASDLGVLPVRAVGAIDNGLTDVLRLTVPAGAGDAIAELIVEAVTAEDPNGNRDAMQLLVLTEDGQIFPTFPQGTDLAVVDAVDGLNESRIVARFPVQGGQVFHVQLLGKTRQLDALGTAKQGEHPVVIEARLVDVDYETEPNNSAIEARQNNTITLPAQVTGWLDKNGTAPGNDAVDRWAFTVANDLGPQRGIIARARSLEGANRYKVSILDENGAPLKVMDNNLRSAAHVSGLLAGTYIAEVALGPVGGNELQYRLDITVDGPVETEPNTAASPQDLGTLGTAPIVMYGYSEKDDGYSFLVNPPLGPDEHVSISMLGFTHSVPNNRVNGTLPLVVRVGAEILGSADETRGLVPTSVAGAGPVTIAHQFGGTLDQAIPGHYRLTIERKAGRAELEPNDVVAEPITLPATLLGTVVPRGAVNDVDRFGFSLAAGLPANTAIEIAGRNLLDDDVLLVELRDAANAVVATASGAAKVRGLSAGGLTAGDYTVVVSFVRAAAPAFTSSNPYELTVRTAPASN